MLKRVLAGAGLFIVALGGMTLMSPPPQAAPDCIFCPQIAIECGPCYNLVHQTCKQCAHCQRIPGCHT